MLPVIPFDILVPLVLGTGMAILALASGIAIRRFLIEWYNQGGQRQVQRAESLLLGAAYGDRDASGVCRWLRRGRAARITSFLQAALRAREEHDGFDEWLQESGIGKTLADRLRLERRKGALNRLRRTFSRWSRIAAAEALGGLMLPEGPEVLAETVGDPDLEVAYVAASGLARQDTIWAASRIFERIGEDTRLYDSRLATLLESMTCDLTEILREGMEAEEAAPRYWALTLIARKKKYELVEEVRPHLDSGEANVRAAATECIGSLGVPLTDRWLLDRLGDNAWFVRSHAARALGKMGAVWAAERLATLLGSSQWWVRSNAIDALVDLGPDSWEAVETVLHSDDRFARNSAVEVLSRTGWTGSTVERAAAGSDLALRNLRVFGTNGGLGYLENALFNVDLDVVPFLLDLLSEIGDDATYGRIRAAGETFPDDLRLRANGVAAALRRGVSVARSAEALRPSA